MFFSARFDFFSLLLSDVIFASFGRCCWTGGKNLFHCWCHFRVWECMGVCVRECVCVRERERVALRGFTRCIKEAHRPLGSPHLTSRRRRRRNHRRTPDRKNRKTGNRDKIGTRWVDKSSMFSPEIFPKPANLGQLEVHGILRVPGLVTMAVCLIDRQPG